MHYLNKLKKKKPHNIKNFKSKHHKSCEGKCWNRWNKLHRTFAPPDCLCLASQALAPFQVQTDC